MNPRILLSSAGSDRASAYAVSNKIVRRGNRLYVGWLDSSEQPGGPERDQLGICDAETGELLMTRHLGDGIDNHCGPALTLDGTGRLHAILGAHSGAFLHRWSDDPEDAASWSAPEAMGPFDTYPSFVADARNTLHLMSRESGPHPRKLIYRRKRANGPWEAPVAVALSPKPGYTHFMQSLNVGPTGRLHATFQYHFSLEGMNPFQAVARLAAHIYSDDDGDTWNQNGTPVSLPLTLETTEGFCAAPEGGLRISNHVVDAQDRIWVWTSHNDAPGGILFRRDPQGWCEIDVTRTLGTLDTRGGREVSMSRDTEGLIHLVVATAPERFPGTWRDARHELFHLVLDETGETRGFRQPTETNPTFPHWLPNVENWNWVRPGCQGGPWMISTREKARAADQQMMTDLILSRLCSPPESL